MALFEVFLFVLKERLIPHVLSWKDEENKVLKVTFLNKGNSKWNTTYNSLFKVMDSFNKSKLEKYITEDNYDSNCKRRFASNMKKFVSKGELVHCNEETDGDARVHVYKMNLSDDEINQRISNLSDQDKENIRTVIAGDNNQGKKRSLSDSTPLPTCQKKLKTNIPAEDLPSTSTVAISLPVTSFTSDDGPSVTIINQTLNFVLPVEALSNPLLYHFINHLAIPKSTFDAQVPSGDTIQGSSSSYIGNDGLASVGNPNEDSFYAPEANGMPENPEPGESDSLSPGHGDMIQESPCNFTANEVSVYPPKANEPLENPLNGENVWINDPDLDACFRDLLLDKIKEDGYNVEDNNVLSNQEIEDPENRAPGDTYNNHLSFPDMLEIEPSISFNDLTG